MIFSPGEAPLAEGLLSFRGVTKHFRDGTVALSDISFSLEEGSFTLLTGANGSGKSVLLKLAGGLFMPNEGEILLKGVRIEEFGEQLFTQVGFIFQDPDSQIVGETVLEDVCFGLRNLGLPERDVQQRSRRALEITGLTGLEEKPPHLLSGGEKRRLSIAGVEAMEPQLLLLDEPFTNLDYPGVISLLKLLLRFHKEGRTIILSSHDLAKCAAHGEYLLHLSKGRLDYSGPVREIINHIPKGELHIPDPALPFERWSWLR